ncbi:MAG: hypothetical protein EBZ49_17245, partial [Proteobacteria bacterium]|nr:hypothetical protein [Pseudomonadota bacterium]
MKTLLSKIRNNSTAREAVLVGGLLLFLAIPVSFSYFFGSDLEIDVPVDTESIEKLGQIYDQGGIESFKTAKKSLRKP